MALEKKDKKMLDTMIEEEISKIPGLVRNLRLPQFQDAFQIKNEPEYVYGYLVGQMEGYIAGIIVGKYGKIPDIGESKEIRKMVEVRAKEIREVMSYHEKKDKIG